MEKLTGEAAWVKHSEGVHKIQTDSCVAAPARSQQKGETSDQR
eukprot:COSAG02_NODE_4412_length_5386_cov_8.158880_3_plen_43_part_00